MRTRRHLVGVVAGALVAALLPMGAALAHPESITTDTTLTDDHVGSISIDEDGVTLDCAGHTVTPADGDLHGIYVYGHDVTVQNCHVTGFTVGITFEWVDGGTLADSSSYLNANAGVRISTSTGVTVTRTASHDNGLSGFFVRNGSTGNRIIDVTSTANGAGLGLYNAANGNEVKGSEFHGNAAVGISVDGSADNLIQGNVVTATTDGPGIWLHNQSHDNVVAGNRSDANQENGVLLTGSSHNTLQGNHADGNAGHGFSLHDAHENLLKGNGAEANGLSGFQIGQTCGAEEHCEANLNVIDGNTVDHNDGGIRLLNAYENEVVRNVTRYNTLGGIGLVVAGGNLIDRNTSLGNGTDLFQDATSQGLGNVFSRNTYETQFGVE